MLTVHHLTFSRSTRVIWLLEELGLPYRLERYERDANFRAPERLKTIHPLGKAPVVEDGGLIIGESAVILQHIDRTYGGGRFTPQDASGRLRHEEWLHYVEGTAAFPVMMAAVGARNGGFTGGMETFVKVTLGKSLDLIEGAVGASRFVMGDGLTLADIQFVYILEMASHAGLLAERPAIATYLERLKAEPGYVRAIEVGGPMAPPKR
ncbi:glutathione S-transferase family protein [Methylopila henanensis]|uniref:Glutathione S-transferase family protein n=1 Tax=Methylopila henanensis TaxID=873516 RepID=A0ABW4K4P4_9HYPH